MTAERHVSSLLIFLASLIMIAANFGLGFIVAQSDFYPLIIFYTVFFAAYLGVYFFVKEKKTIYYFIGLGVCLRFMLIFAFPNLSDDIYRFIWDGCLAINGINPFNHLPSYFIENNILVPGINEVLFKQLNSPDYFTIYPPLCQGIFAFSCWLFPESWAGSAMVMKVFLFVFECGSIWLIIKILRHFKLREKRILLYALNPLVIIEIMGNLHFEGAMAFFLLLSVYLLLQKKIMLSAISIALSIASKLLPLIFLPLLIKRLGWKKSLQYFSICGITLLLFFSPMLNVAFIENFTNSLDLYFRKFEFNASIYYLMRWFGRLITGYNQISIIGPSLALVVFISIMFWVFKEKKSDFISMFTMMLFAICLYLFLATTVHPWYTILPLTLCIFTRFRFPILWSLLIFSTYINYSYPSYFENLWIVGMEYVLVFSYLAYEFSIKTNLALTKRQ